MQKLIADSYYDIGGYRDVYEDRVATRRLTTPGGLKIVVAVVADGVGGENKGERAAQTAHDAFFTYLEKSRETVIPDLLTNAVQYANKAVYQLQRETGGASTTLTVAVVDEMSNKLFIANVGDSRVYICRNQKLTQLSLDHSFANVMLWRGVISAEAARSHPRASVLMRAIGPKEQVEVDVGFYVDTTDYAEANARGIEGLPLKDGDAVLVCSDGLIKDSPKTHQLLITTEEIVRTLHDKEGRKAAQELVSFALGRGPDDNISAAIIQMPDRWRTWRARRPAILIAGIIILLLAIVFSTVSAQLTTQGTRLTQIALVQRSTDQMSTEIAAFTPTPTITSTLTPLPTTSPTPTPTLPPVVEHQAALVDPGAKILLEGESYQVGTSAAQMKIYHRANIANGFLYALPGSRLTFDLVETTDNKQSIFQLSIDPRSQGFLSTGGYNQAYLIVSTLNIRFSIQGCFAINYTDSPAVVTGSCYGGSCAYSLSSADKIQIPDGNQVIFDASGKAGDKPLKIPETDARKWASLLPVGSQAFDCANRLVPTPTPRPTLPPPTQTTPPKTNPKPVTPNPNG